MSHNWRKIEQGDYTMLQRWWDDWGWETSPTLSMLPQTGVLVYDKEIGTPLYAGFLYYTGTTIAWMEFVVSNKDAAIKQRKGALNYLVEVFSVMAKNNGVEMIFTSTVLPAFVNSLKKCDFVVGDVNNTQLIKKL